MTISNPYVTDFISFVTSRRSLLARLADSVTGGFGTSELRGVLRQRHASPGATPARLSTGPLRDVPLRMTEADRRSAECEIVGEVPAGQSLIATDLCTPSTDEVLRSIGIGLPVWMARCPKRFGRTGSFDGRDRWSETGGLATCCDGLESGRERNSRNIRNPSSRLL
jgi:hypothetical protein